jgi:predicted metal-dependent hydrolase
MLRKSLLTDKELRERAKELESILNSRIPNINLKTDRVSIIFGTTPRGTLGVCRKQTNRSKKKSLEILISNELIDSPTIFVDYVLVHEILHLYKWDHGIRFQKAMRSVFGSNYEVIEIAVNLALVSVEQGKYTSINSFFKEWKLEI